MEKDGADFASALREAQDLGYAEGESLRRRRRLRRSEEDNDPYRDSHG